MLIQTYNKDLILCIWKELLISKKKFYKNLQLLVLFNLLINNKEIVRNSRIFIKMMNNKKKIYIKNAKMYISMQIFSNQNKLINWN